MPPTIIPAGRGIRHTRTWADKQRPQSPREGMFYLYPNGDARLTAILSGMKSEKPTDPRFSEFTKNLPSQTADITGVYTDQALSSAFSAGTHAAGTLLYFKMSSDHVKEFRAGHVGLVRVADAPAQDTHIDVVAAVENGDNSYVAGKLLVNIADSTSAPNPANASRLLCIGNANREGSTMPDSVNYNPVEMWNYTQIFLTPYEVTGTQMATRLVTGDAYKEEKREKHELHAIEMEKAFFFGKRYITTENGKPKRYTMGIIPMVYEYAPTNVFNFTTETDAAFAGKKWEEAGMDWMEAVTEKIMRYGPSERTTFWGSGARLGLNTLARNWGSINIEPGQDSMGINIETWYGISGLNLHILTHPLFSYEESNRHTVVIVSMKNIVEKPLRQTRVLRDKNDTEGGLSFMDGKKEAWLTETGLMFRHPYTFAVLHGVGQDNTVGI